MEFKIFIVKKENFIFKIEEDYPEVGAYFYVFQDNNCVFDSLQENYSQCIELALELYNIPKEEWVLIDYLEESVGEL